MRAAAKSSPRGREPIRPPAGTRTSAVPIDRMDQSEAEVLEERGCRSMLATAGGEQRSGAPVVRLAPWKWQECPRQVRLDRHERNSTVKEERAWLERPSRSGS